MLLCIYRNVTRAFNGDYLSYQYFQKRYKLFAFHVIIH